MKIIHSPVWSDALVMYEAEAIHGWSAVEET